MPVNEALDTQKVTLEATHNIQSLLQFLELVLLDHQGLVVQVFDDEIVFGRVDLEDDSLDRGVTFHQHS